MQWHIISIGDEAYLLKIFQFLSMLNSPGTSLYGKIGMLGALIGLMLVLFQAVGSGGRQFGLGPLFLGVAFFTVFFGTSTTVVLEDFHTGRTDVVENVPLGTAIVGTLVSQSGVELIDLFQQGTAVPGQEVMPADYALEALAATRGLTSSAVCTGNSALCGFTRTLSNYVKDCVIPAYAGMGRTDGQQGWWNGNPTTSDNALAAMDVDNNFVMTEDSLHGGGTTTQPESCKTTYDDIQTAAKSTPITDAMAAQLLAAANQKLPEGAAAGTATSQALELLANSYGGLMSGADTGSGQNDGQISSWISQAQQSAGNVMLNATVAEALHDATERDRSMTNADVANAAMIQSAAMSRDEKYAAEESMFGRTLQATMAFFEGIIYGMAPFLAFLIPLGAVGVRYMVRYLLLLIWLFLWLPLLSFVNLFEIMSVMRTMNALAPARAGASLTSMVGIMEVQNSAADWIAMGGWLTTSVIGIAGMVVFGSVAAFQSIAAAAHGPDSIDPSVMAPEVARSAPEISVGPQFQSSGGAALMRAGAADMTIGVSNQFSHQLRMMQSRLVAMQHGLGMNVSDGHALDYKQAQAWAQEQVAADKASAGINHTVGGGGQQSAGQDNKYQEQVGTSTHASHAYKADVKDTLTGRVGTPFAGIIGDGVTDRASASIGAEAGTGVSHTTSASQTVGGSTSGRVDAKQGESADLHSGVESGTTDKEGNSGGVSYDTARSAQWNQQVQEMLSETKKYDEMVSEQSAVQSSGSATESQIGAALPKNEAAFDAVQGAVTQLGGGAYARNLAGQLEPYFPDATQAQAVANMMTLDHMMNDSSVSPAVRSEATSALMTGLKAVNPGLGSVDTNAVSSFLGSGGAIAGVQSATSGVWSTGQRAGTAARQASPLADVGDPIAGTSRFAETQTADAVGTSRDPGGYNNPDSYYKAASSEVEHDTEGAVKRAQEQEKEDAKRAYAPSRTTSVGDLESPADNHAGGATGGW